MFVAFVESGQHLHHGHGPAVVKVRPGSPVLDAGRGIELAARLAPLPRAHVVRFQIRVERRRMAFHAAGFVEDLLSAFRFLAQTVPLTMTPSQRVSLK